MERVIYKWIVTVRFVYNKAKDPNSIVLAEGSYNRWKSQVLRSVKTATEKDFNDKAIMFNKVLDEPKDIYDYIICCNPVPTDDILDNAEVTFKRVKMITNKTGSIMKEVKFNEKERRTE